MENICEPNKPFSKDSDRIKYHFCTCGVTFSFCSKLFYFLCDSGVCKHAIKFGNYIMIISWFKLSMKVARQSSTIDFLFYLCEKKQKEIECKICIKAILEL